MSYILVITNYQHFPLATITGWKDFKAWADSLDFATYPHVINLSEWGYTEELPILADELEAALANNAPDDATVTDTATQLMENVRSAPEESAGCYVSDGTIIKPGKRTGALAGLNKYIGKAVQKKKNRSKA